MLRQLSATSCCSHCTNRGVVSLDGAAYGASYLPTFVNATAQAVGLWSKSVGSGCNNVSDHSPPLSIEYSPHASSCTGPRLPCSRANSERLSPPKPLPSTITLSVKGDSMRYASAQKNMGPIHDFPEEGTFIWRAVWAGPASYAAAVIARACNTPYRKLVCVCLSSCSQT